MRLSGGERQRISLARAFLKNAPILILDESTSAVDARTETVMMEAMAALVRNRTTIVITHRPAPLRDCDVHFRISDGSLDQVRQRLVDPCEALLLGASSVGSIMSSSSAMDARAEASDRVTLRPTLHRSASSWNSSERPLQ